MGRSIFNYASPGSVVKDPTAPAGKPPHDLRGDQLLHGNDWWDESAGTSHLFDRRYDLYVTTAALGPHIAVLRPTASSTFRIQNPTQGPNAPSGATGAAVCAGDDCTTTPAGSYGRYPVLSTPTTLTSLIATRAARLRSSSFPKVNHPPLLTM